MFKKVQLLKTFVKLVVFLGACFFVSQMSSGHALAASTCNAGGTWVQADVWVKVVDYQGNLQYWSDNFSFNVQALVPKGSAGAPYLENGDAFDNAPGQDIQTGGNTWVTSSLNFNSAGHTHSCFGSPAYDFTDGSNGNIFLNCLNANHDANGGAGFAFTPTSVNDSGAAGGSFTNFETFTDAPSNQNGNVAYYFPSWSGIYGTGGFSDLNYAHLMTIIWTYKLPKPQANIQGNVYTASGVELYNVPIDNNHGTGGSTEDQNGNNPGWFNFSLNGGTGFSVRVPSTVKQNGHQYSNPKIQPWGPNGDGTSGPHDASCKGNDTSYEYQVANNPHSTGSCDYIPPKADNNRGYDIAYQTDQVPTIQGTIYAHTTGSGKVGLPGITIPTTHTNGPTPGNCTAGETIAQSTTSDSTGSYSFQVGVDDGFCVRIPLTYEDANHTHYSSLVITPLNSTGISGNLDSYGSNNCSSASASYEWQKAEVDKSGTKAGDNIYNYYCAYGLSSNRGYDFLYQKVQRADIAATTTATPTQVYPGSQVTFTSTSTVSNTLPDDAGDHYTYEVAPSIDPANAGDTTFTNATPPDCTVSESVGILSSDQSPSGSQSSTCVISISSDTAPGTKYCITTTISNQPSYANVSGSPAQACVTVLAPPTITLGPAASHEIGSGSPANITYTVNCNDFNGPLTYNIAVSSTPASVPMPASLAPTTSNCTTNATFTGTIVNTAASLDGIAPNKYVYTPSITGAAGVPNLPISGTPVILDNYTVPYARFYGGDIMSGGGTGAIIFNVNPPQGNAVGSAAEYAAVAKTTISLASAAFRSGSVDSLTAKISASPNIASTRNTSGGTWANDFNTSGYYGDVTGTTTINRAANATGKVTVVGNDIYINGDITVDTTNLPPPSGSASFNDSQTPSLVFIAAQNIYINHSVHRIDASLQAIAGTIYTCADTGNNPATAVAIGSECQIPLTVNGSVGAKTIKFNRSCGTRLKATSGEDNPSTALPGLLDRGSVCSTGMAAEVFNLPNYLYFTSSTGNSGSKMQFQSLYSAPPLL